MQYLRKMIYSAVISCLPACILCVLGWGGVGEVLSPFKSFFLFIRFVTLSGSCEGTQTNDGPSCSNLTMWLVNVLLKL